MNSPGRLAQGSERAEETVPGGEGVFGGSSGGGPGGTGLQTKVGSSPLANWPNVGCLDVHQHRPEQPSRAGWHTARGKGVHRLAPCGTPAPSSPAWDTERVYWPAMQGWLGLCSKKKWGRSSLEPSWPPRSPSGPLLYIGTTIRAFSGAAQQPQGSPLRSPRQTPLATSS